MKQFPNSLHSKSDSNAAPGEEQASSFPLQESGTSQQGYNQDHSQEQYFRPPVQEKPNSATRDDNLSEKPQANDMDFMADLIGGEDNGSDWDSNESDASVAYMPSTGAAVNSREEKLQSASQHSIPEDSGTPLPVENSVGEEKIVVNTMSSPCTKRKSDSVVTNKPIPVPRKASRQESKDSDKKYHSGDSDHGDKPTKSLVSTIKKSPFTAEINQSKDEQKSDWDSDSESLPIMDDSCQKSRSKSNKPETTKHSPADKVMASQKPVLTSDHPASTSVEKDSHSSAASSFDNQETTDGIVQEENERVQRPRVTVLKNGPAASMEAKRAMLEDLFRGGRGLCLAASLDSDEELHVR